MRWPKYINKIDYFENSLDKTIYHVTGPDYLSPYYTSNIHLLLRIWFNNSL